MRNLTPNTPPEAEIIENSTDEEEPETETQPPTQPSTQLSLIQKLQTKSTPQFIPDSEIFDDLETLYVMRTPDKVVQNMGKGDVVNKVEPPLFCYFDPPNGDLPEINYNAVNVFKSWKDVDKLECIDADTVRDILMRPCQDFRPFVEMKMMTDEGAIVPCHLPLLGDMYGMSDVFFILLAWEIQRLKAIKSPRFLPESLRTVIDPRPNLKLDGPVHDFGREPVRIAMGSYTDAVHIMKLTQENTNFTLRVVRSAVYVKRNDGDQRPRRWYHEIVFVPHTVGPQSDTLPVQVNSTLVVWNSRGVARLSFLEYFNIIVQVYKPKIVVVLEARISQINLVQLMDKVEGVYDCGMFGSENFYGGVLVFWKSCDVELYAHQNCHKGCKADVKVKGTAPAKVRKCLFMKDVSDGKLAETGN